MSKNATFLTLHKNFYQDGVLLISSRCDSTCLVSLRVYPQFQVVGTAPEVEGMPVVITQVGPGVIHLALNKAIGLKKNPYNLKTKCRNKS